MSTATLRISEKKHSNVAPPSRVLTFPICSKSSKSKHSTNAPPSNAFVCNKNLKTINDEAFLFCSKLEDVQLASSSISFGFTPFVGCDRLIEIAGAAGFPSNTFDSPFEGRPVNFGDGVVPYLSRRHNVPLNPKLIVEKDVEEQLRSDALHKRLQDERLSHGSIELYLRCNSLTAIGWGTDQPFWSCSSLLRVDLSGCPKLESIPELSFGECRHLVSVVFGGHSKITNLGVAAFQRCSALMSITLPNKLKVIETMAFNNCSALERVVYNKTSRLLAIAHSCNAPSSKMSSLHPARFSLVTLRCSIRWV